MTEDEKTIARSIIAHAGACFPSDCACCIAHRIRIQKGLLSCFDLWPGNKTREDRVQWFKSQFLWEQEDI